MPEGWKCPGVALPSGEVMHHVRCRPRDGGEAGCRPIRRYPAHEKGWGAWTKDVDDCLKDLGAHEKADARWNCGRNAWVISCAKCGADPARIVVPATCGGRTCPMCSRGDSLERAGEIEGAMALVPECADAEAVKTLEKLERDRARHQAVSDYWYEKACTWAEAKRPKAIERSEAAAKRARRCAAWIKEAKRRHRWRWRFITLTCWYDPSNPEHFTPDALRDRAEKLLKQWSAVWGDWLRVGGLAAASAHIEMSTSGHVHAHILYWGPWVSHRKAAGAEKGPSYFERLQLSVSGNAGWSDVREVHGDVHKEIAKYATKAPTVSTPAWLSGAPRVVLNPRVAAAWEVALHELKIWRHFGSMRLAVARVREEVPEDWEGWACAVCGNPLGRSLCEVTANHERTSAVARAALDRHRASIAAHASLVSEWIAGAAVTITAAPNSRPFWPLAVQRER